MACLCGFTVDKMNNLFTFAAAPGVISGSGDRYVLGVLWRRAKSAGYPSE